MDDISILSRPSSPLPPLRDDLKRPPSSSGTRPTIEYKTDDPRSLRGTKSVTITIPTSDSPTSSKVDPNNGSVSLGSMGGNELPQPLMGSTIKDKHHFATHTSSSKQHQLADSSINNNSYNIRDQRQQDHGQFQALVRRGVNPIGQCKKYNPTPLSCSSLSSHPITVSHLSSPFLNRDTLPSSLHSSHNINHNHHKTYHISPHSTLHYDKGSGHTISLRHLPKSTSTPHFIHSNDSILKGETENFNNQGYSLPNQLSTENQDFSSSTTTFFYRNLPFGTSDPTQEMRNLTHKSNTFYSREQQQKSLSNPTPPPIIPTFNSNLLSKTTSHSKKHMEDHLRGLLDDPLKTQFNENKIQPTSNLNSQPPQQTPKTPFTTQSNNHPNNSIEFRNPSPYLSKSQSDKYFDPIDPHYQFQQDLIHRTNSRTLQTIYTTKDERSDMLTTQHDHSTSLFSTKTIKKN